MDHDEKTLIEKSQKGDVESFEILITSYQKTAFNIAYRMLGNFEDANDITQEAFIKVYKSIDKFKGESSFTTWLYAIVNNICLDFLRKKKKIKIISIDKSQGNENYQREIPDETNTPEVLFEKKEVRRTVQDAINQLKDEHRTIIILRDIQGFSYEEIAEILDISTGTVKSRISRARRSLKVIIGNGLKVTTGEEG
ncbi:MAG: sigma-70 family RNA polymerase sigma factor [Clostridiaceae bacterium]|nr:sigma-70 family RNA polymerase sigma factor [Clostridiaceae bacterium]